VLRFLEHWNVTQNPGLRSVAPKTEVLQLSRRDLIGWLDAPAHGFGFGSFQVAAIRTRGHPAGGWVVPALLSVLPRRGRTPLLVERGLSVDHVTVWRRVQRYAPEINAVATAAPTDQRQLRVDETYVRVKGKWVSLYRAVDSTGATIDFLLSAKRDAAAAERFLA
jgi:hypothetical protein